MTVEYKAIDEITFEDVEDFCAQRRPEGIRLDYKADVPKDLAKIVAAFANTLGGAVLLGVQADQTKNEPVLPVKGMPEARGLADRVVSICQDNPYPPIRPEVKVVS